MKISFQIFLPISFLDKVVISVNMCIYVYVFVFVCPFFVYNFETEADGWEAVTLLITKEQPVRN